MAVFSFINAANSISFVYGAMTALIPFISCAAAVIMCVKTVADIRRGVSVSSNTVAATLGSVSFAFLAATVFAGLFRNDDGIFLLFAVLNAAFGIAGAVFGCISCKRGGKFYGLIFSGFALAPFEVYAVLYVIFGVLLDGRSV